MFIPHGTGLIRLSMAPVWPIHGFVALGLVVICVAGETTSLLEDANFLLQVVTDVKSGPAMSPAIIPNPDLPTPSPDSLWQCREGDILLAFHAGRDCSDFTEEELDMPMSKWPYMTRWCKLARRDKTMQMDQCMAQHCIERQSPILAAKVWWETKTGKSDSWQNIEFPYCSKYGFCSGHPLSHNSTLQDMESYCNTKFGDSWKKQTPRDTLTWIQQGVGNIEMLTCSWGTLHCDVTRCNQYLCGPKAQQVALTRMKQKVHTIALEKKASHALALTQASDVEQALKHDA